MPSIGPAFGTGVNEHFKPFFNDGLATVVVMLISQGAKNDGGRHCLCAEDRTPEGYPWINEPWEPVGSGTVTAIKGRARQSSVLRQIP